MRSSIVCRVSVLAIFAACDDGGRDGMLDCDEPDLHTCFPELDRQIDGESEDQPVVSDELDMCVSGDGTIHVAWVDDRQGFRDVWLASSNDGGMTWPTPIKVKKGGGEASAVDLACVGKTVVAVWEDTRDSDTDYQNIYLNFSLDGGATWQAEDVALDGDPQGRAISLAPQVVLHRDREAGFDRVMVTWFDQVEGAPDVYVATGPLNRAGLEMSPPVRVSGGELAGEAWSGNPRAAVGGDGRLHVAWEDKSDGAQDVYYRGSDAAASTWGDDVPRLSVGVPAGEEFSFSPDICASGDHVYVVWHDTRGGEGRDIFFNYSSDGGQSWWRGGKGGGARRADSDAAGAAESFNARVACDGGFGHVVWQDNRHGAYDIFYRRLAGDTPVEDLEPEVRLDVGDTEGRNISEHPVIVKRGDTLLVAWEDRRGAGEVALTDLYYNYQLLGEDGTVSQDWLDDQDVRIDSIETGTKYAEGLHVDVRDDVVYASWIDNRDGDEDKDIYFSRSFLGEGAMQYAELRDRLRGGDR